MHDCSFLLFLNEYYSFPVMFLVYGFLVMVLRLFIFYVFITKSCYIFIKLFLKLNSIMTQQLQLL